jgi:hypothetical protein
MSWLWFAVELREEKFIPRQVSLFHWAFVGRFLVTPNSKRPRWRIARGESSHQIAVNLILAYLVNIRLANSRFKPVFVLCHILRRNAITLLLSE